MNTQEFAAKVRSKYPGSYDDLDDSTLTEKVLSKYPQYKDMVDEEGPSKLGSFARGAMSGIPGAESVVSGIQALDPNVTYEQAHKKLEEDKNKDWETNPVSYGVGKTAGFVGTALAAPVTETLGGAAAVGAGIGALSGADASDKLSDIPLDAVKGAGEGAVLGGAVHGITSAAGKILPSLGKNTVAAMGAKTTVPDIEAYLANPESINSALSKTQIGEKIANLTGDVGTASSQLSGQARELLNPENSPLNIKNLKDITMDAVQKYYTEGVPATAADETAIKSIVSQYQKLAQIAETNGGEVPETTLRAMIDRLQAATKDSTFGNPEAGAAQTALKELSGKLNDALRQANPDYAAGMAPSAEMAKLSGTLKDQFKLEPNYEGKLAPTDSTINKVGNVLKEGKTEGADALEQLKNATGQDLQDMIQKSNVKGNFDAEGSGTGMKTLLASLGFGAGKMTGIPFGGIGGAAVGRFAAEGVNGGNVAKGILDMYLKGTNSAYGKAAAKFGPILANAAKVGGNQLAATHFVLATSDPEYQELVNHVQDNSEGQ